MKPFFYITIIKVATAFGVPNSESCTHSYRDPIVRTSTVDGLCMKAEHCSNLPGTQCKTVEDTEYMTCQCIEGSTKGKAVSHMATLHTLQSCQICS